MTWETRLASLASEERGEQRLGCVSCQHGGLDSARFDQRQGGSVCRTCVGAAHAAVVLVDGNHATEKFHRCAAEEVRPTAAGFERLVVEAGNCSEGWLDDSNGLAQTMSNSSGH